MRNKLWWNKNLVGPSRSLSASTKRSVEQKIVEQKCWWGLLQTLSASTKRSAEQKMVEQKFWWGPLDPKCKY